VAAFRGDRYFPGVREPGHNAASWIARHAARAGARPAVADAERRLDYAQLEHRIARLAGWLAARGVERGDRVAFLLVNRTAALETVFASARLGAIALPINTRLSPREVCFLLDDARPRALVAESSFAPLVQRACELARSAPSVRLGVDAALADGDASDYETALADAAFEADIAPVSPEDPMILMYTSGTTGNPKGALLPHRKALYNSLNAELYFGIVPADRVLVVSPLFHSLGLQILALPALYCGASLLLQAHFEPAALWQAVAREGITYLGAVPTVYQRLLDELEAAGPDHYDLRSLRFLFTAGAAAPAELVRAYRARGLLLVQGYGQTESSTLTCLSGEDALRKAGSVGLPVHHAELRVVAVPGIDGPVAGWRDVAPGEPGEIVVRGPIVMLGYWERPDANRETLRDGWLRTGDLATRDDEGFVTLVGRSREMFISGGENVYPAEIEARYAEHPAIREIAVVGVPDARWGEVGHAYVVLEPGAEASEAELAAWGRERLARFKIPSRFVFEAELPKTASGKVQKHRLLASSKASSGERSAERQRA
jgi:fatty-acyl-CoA synthase